MWLEILCGVVFYKLFRYFIYGDDGVPNDADDDSAAIFAVSKRLEKVYGGKGFVGLRIPDPDTGSRQHIDVVIVSKKELIVVAVRNFTGFLDIGSDGNWVCTRDKKHKPETYLDPVMEVTRQAAILTEYLEHRGVILPKGHLIRKVVLPNPNCSVSYTVAIQPEVIPFDQWMALQPEPKWTFSEWFKDTFHRGNDEIQDGFYQKLHFVLSTAPMWDRLEFRGEKNILGEFMDFKGNQEDMQALRNIKRAKVNNIIIQKATMLGLDRSRVNVLYSSRDYRSEGLLASEWKHVAVKPNTEVLFQPVNSKRPRKFRLTSITSVSLSA